MTESDNIETNEVKQLKGNLTPIWHRPVWITAIVGLVTALLTIPDKVSNYYSKQQDIKLAIEKTRSQSLINSNQKQEQEFKIFNNTLARQGHERVFVLRYLAKTLDDTAAKEWAQSEVERLDDLAKQERQLEIKLAELQSKEKQLEDARTQEKESTAELQAELKSLKKQIASQNAKLFEAIQNAGLTGEKKKSKRSRMGKKIYTLILLSNDENDLKIKSSDGAYEKVSRREAHEILSEAKRKYGDRLYVAMDGDAAVSTGQLRKLICEFRKYDYYEYYGPRECER